MDEYARLPEVIPKCQNKTQSGSEDEALGSVSLQIFHAYYALSLTHRPDVRLRKDARCRASMRAGSHRQTIRQCHYFV